MLKGLAFAPTAATVPSQPDLTVNVSGQSAGYTNVPFTYTLAADNIGSVTTASGAVTVQFTLPAGVSYVSAADTGSDGFTASYNQNTGVVTFSGGPSTPTPWTI